MSRADRILATDNPPVCPICQTPMIKKAANAGGCFWGCIFGARLCQFLASTGRARYVKDVDRAKPTSQGDVDFRVLIAGGGTGGHLFPGVALAQRVRDGGGNVTFAGTDRGIEARVLPALGWTLDLLDVAGIKGGGVRGVLRGRGEVEGRGVGRDTGTVK